MLHLDIVAISPTLSGENGSVGENSSERNNLGPVPAGTINGEQEAVGRIMELISKQSKHPRITASSLGIQGTW